MVPAISNTKVDKGTTYIGIDFGTSTTVITHATFDNGEKKINTIPIRIHQYLEDGTEYESEKLPSVIAFFQNIILVGEGASRLKYQMKKGKNIWYSFKMEIGEDLGAKYYESELVNHPTCEIKNPKDAVRVFFLYLRSQIEMYCQEHNLSQDIKYAVSIPASFEANQRKELMEALEVNGMMLTKQSLIDEPNAAFISYVHESQMSEKPLVISPNYNPKVLVFDFGGGTCDISILEVGKNYSGLYSKNVSISKFTKLGGDDLDRYLTCRYLLPRFLASNNKKIEDFHTPERKFIESQLYKAAEQLKINICKALAVRTDNYIIDHSLRNCSERHNIEVPVNIETRKGLLFQKDFYLTNSELSEAMKTFLKQSKLPTQFKGEDDYNNIFMPIESAIKKANIKKEELDYILLIGGSAQNPFIQEALKIYFEDSEILIPRDLQTHVSQGAAIHSLLMNGMNKCIIQPITSEPIFVLTKDTSMKVLMPAGTVIPSDTAVVDDLVTIRDNQEAIELPICVGNKNKMLFNLKITKNGGFPVNTPVKLAIEINADKLLVAQASCMGMSCTVEPQNPFANKELTTEERIVLVAERQSNIEALQNGGAPTRQSLIALRQAYKKAGNVFRAAETYELQNELYPNPSDYNSIGVMYDDAGSKDKAIEFYERALQYNPNSVYPNFNLGHSLEHRDPQRAEQLLRKAYGIDPSHCPSMIELADLEAQNGNAEQARDLRQQAYEKLLQRWKTDTMSESDYSWLSYVANQLGHRDIAAQVRSSVPKLETESYYNEDNLTRTNTTQLTKK